MSQSVTAGHMVGHWFRNWRDVGAGPVFGLVAEGCYYQCVASLARVCVCWAPSHTPRREASSTSWAVKGNSPVQVGAGLIISVGFHLPRL